MKHNTRIYRDGLGSVVGVLFLRFGFGPFFAHIYGKIEEFCFAPLFRGIYSQYSSLNLNVYKIWKVTCLNYILWTTDTESSIIGHRMFTKSTSKETNGG